jgi:hypothetical protein
MQFLSVGVPEAYPEAVKRRGDWPALKLVVDRADAVGSTASDPRARC